MPIRTESIGAGGAVLLHCAQSSPRMLVVVQACVSRFRPRPAPVFHFDVLQFVPRAFQLFQAANGIYRADERVRADVALVDIEREPLLDPLHFQALLEVGFVRPGPVIGFPESDVDVAPWRPQGWRPFEKSVSACQTLR